MRPATLRRTRTWVGLLTVLLAGPGCHARRADPPAKAEGPSPEILAETPRPEGLPPAPEPLASDDPCDIPLAVSPEGLLAPGAAARLQAGLVERGFLDPRHDDGELDRPTLEALREFQARQGLPRTGLPDYATVRALGFDPASIFRHRDPERCPPPEEGP